MFRALFRMARGTFLSLGKSMDCRYAAAAKDEAKISSCAEASSDPRSPVSSVSSSSSSRGNRRTEAKWVHDEECRFRTRPTSSTLSPSVSNFLPYCFLDLVELLVTNTSRLP